MFLFILLAGTKFYMNLTWSQKCKFTVRYCRFENWKTVFGPGYKQTNSISLFGFKTSKKTTAQSYI